MMNKKTNKIEDILKSKKTDKDLLEETSKRISKEEMKRSEAENVIRMMFRAGIPKELVGWNRHAFREYCNENLNSDLHAGNSETDAGGMSDRLYDLHSNWHNGKLVIIVDGGTRDTRIKLSQLILARVILCSFLNVGKIGITLPFSMLKVKFNSFDKDRQTLVNNLGDIPALYVQEISEASGFRTSSDGAALMDQMLDTRETPLVLSLCSPVEKFLNANTYGSSFSDLLDVSKGRVFIKDKVWRFNLRSKIFPTDPILFKKKYDEDFAKKLKDSKKV